MIRLMLTCLFFLVTSATTAGQANPAGNAEFAEETAWVMPRTEYGVPDFQGTWFFGSRTPLQRPRNLGTQTTYSEQEIREQELQMRLRLEDQAAPLNPGRSAPEAGAEIRQEADRDADSGGVPDLCHHRSAGRACASNPQRLPGLLRPQTGTRSERDRWTGRSAPIRALPHLRRRDT